MGRITLFTADHCLFSLRLKHELEARSLPYTEISLTKYPAKRETLNSLTHGVSWTTPQAYFNTRHVGGYDATMKELQKQWDKKTKQFSTPLEKYQKQMEPFPDPTDSRLMVPDDNDEVESLPATLDLATIEQKRKTVQLDLPNGSSKTYTVWGLSELLTNILPVSKLHYHLMTYKQSVTGTAATAALAKYYECTPEQAEAIGQQLHAMGLLHHVTYDHDFCNTAKYYYRLQCHQTPHILNSLYLSNDNNDDNSNNDNAEDGEALVLQLEKMIDTITRSCLKVDAKKGGIQYKQGAKHALFGELQEAICRLQLVSIDQMDPKALLAFGLNLYNIMMQFAFFKLGFPATKSHQQDFLKGIKFNVGGMVYSFYQWLGAISQGNIGDEPESSKRKSLLVPKRPSSNPDPRRSIAASSSEQNHSETSYTDSESPTGIRRSVVTISRTSTKEEKSIKAPLVVGSSSFSMADYRLYFAINFFWSRASVVPHFTSDNIDEELTWMAFAFCENDANVHINEQKGELHLSSIFNWHRKHFVVGSSSSSDKDLAQLVCEFVGGAKKLQLRKVLSSEYEDKFKVSFHQDEWTTNAAKKEFLEFKPSMIDANCARF